MLIKLQEMNTTVENLVIRFCELPMVNALHVSLANSHPSAFSPPIADTAPVPSLVLAVAAQPSIAKL